MYIQGIAKGKENINTPLGCVAKWVDDVSTLEETMDCINYNMEKNNNTKTNNQIYNT